jgi:hypothetical protein
MEEYFLYIAIIVFLLLMIGIILTVIEFKNVK